MSSNWSGKPKLTSQSKGDDYSPSFSADGMQVVYVHEVGLRSSGWTATGRDLGVHGREPQFLPGGRYIVFYRLIKYFDDGKLRDVVVRDPCPERMRSHRGGGPSDRSDVRP